MDTNMPQAWRQSCMLISWNKKKLVVKFCKSSLILPPLAELVSSENRRLTVTLGHVHNTNWEQLEAQMSPSQGTWLQTLILNTSNALNPAAGGCDVPSCMRDATTFCLSEGLDELSTAGSNVWSLPLSLRLHILAACFSFCSVRCVSHKQRDAVHQRCPITLTGRQKKQEGPKPTDTTNGAPGTPNSL